MDPILSVERGRHVCCLNYGYSGCEGGSKCEVEIDISARSCDGIGDLDESIG